MNIPLVLWSFLAAVTMTVTAWIFRRWAYYRRDKFIASLDPVTSPEIAAALAKYKETFDHETEKTFYLVITQAWYLFIFFQSISLVVYLANG